MAKNWAICVGINHYNNMPNLQYAQRDAELMRDYFLKEAGFEKVYLLTDNSPPINDAGQPFNSQPTYGTLRRFLRVRFDKEFLSAGDNFWFFYSGHGMRFKDRDYLMPADADPHPEGVEKTAIPLYFVTERLRRCGADNIILFLDACRSQESSRGLGIGEEKQKGVITFFSCSPNERSYEIEDEKIKQGAFTYALLESLRIKGEGNCATVERLYNRLSYRVPDINHQFGKPPQTPYTVVEPATKHHLILLEKQANLSDIAILKNDAYRAEVDKNIELARQLWTRIKVASNSDMEAIDAISRLSNAINYSELDDNKALSAQGTKSSLSKVGKRNSTQSPTHTLKSRASFVKGISLIELLVAVVIITILSAIALPTFLKLAKGKVKCYSGTGHCYEFVPGQWTWTQAKALAESRSYKGSRGYLVTITSQGEQDFIVSNFTTTNWGGWIGASDAQEEGVWKWVTGPETGTVFWDNGEEIGYNNFSSNQPNNEGQEDYAHLGYFEKDTWNDIGNDTSRIRKEHRVVGYYVEYGD